MPNLKKSIEVLKASALVLYGAGFYGTTVYLMLKEMGIMPSCFCDKKQIFFEPQTGLPVILPHELMNEYMESNILITSLDFADEILCDLLNLGINEERIFFVDDFEIMGKPSIYTNPIQEPTKMKILFYLATFGIGGQERVVANLSAAFTEKGYEVVVVSALRTYNEYTVICHKKIYLNLPLNDLVSIERKLSEIISNESPAVLVGFAPLNAVLLNNARKHSPALTASLIFSQRVDPAYMLTTVPKCDEYYKTMISEADGAVFQTQRAQMFFPEELRRKSTVINNQVSKRFFSIARSGKRKNIVGVGRLVLQKNWIHAIEAFSLISSKVDDNFVIYGVGTEYDNIKKYINELNLSARVVLAGISQELEKIVVNAKLFVMSSDAEGLPNALIEALVMGVPCVSTVFDGGAAEQLITSGENGLLVPKDDAEALAKAMLKLLTDDEYAERIAINAKERASIEFDPERIFMEWEEYILNVVNQYKDRQL